ncbi:MAG: L-threonylcarbamoyladenylate synthase [Atopococcus tabaci]|uniref:Threonylcarbamoyl-AMP synthase n=1 Tax=Atopococcus tabaci TaxID=269774 RepID=A0AA43ZSZ8_9LACT|nr:L-threonylcarbamoyladenylate synthase [Atopococcus tabaci]
MKTEYLSMKEIERAAGWIQKGETVAFQTETVYGLGADATNKKAVQKIYQAKGRPSDNPLIIHVARRAQVLEYCEDISPQAKMLMDAFWPGPLTLILKAQKNKLAIPVTAGLDTVGIRFPATEAAQKLIRLAGVPLAAPSANTSGRPSPTTAHHVLHDLDGKIAAVLDSGPAQVGLESTIVDLTAGSVPVILRPGGISREAVEEVVGPVSVSKPDLQKSDIAKAPGMKYKHYAPDEDLFIVDGPEEDWREKILDLKDEGQQVGIIANEDLTAELGSIIQASYSLGRKGDAESAASRLFDALRHFEKTGVTVILAEAYPETGLGLAYMNRLDKAADHRYL